MQYHNVGVVGVGAMGAPIARHLAAAGHRVLAYDRRPEALTGLDVTTVAELEGLASAEAVLLLVPTDADVLDAATRLAGLVHRGTVLVICSSVQPDTCRRIGERSTLHGVDVVDAALTGGVRAAERAAVHLLVGGDAGTVARLRSLFDAFCARVTLLGPLGAGQVGKMVNNLLHWSTIAAVAEALQLATRLGVPAPAVRAALLGGPTDSRTLQELDQFRLTWWQKDLDNALAMAAELDHPLPLAKTVREQMPAITVSLLRSLVDTAA
jgi:3-hydroxyisobutyrate dehydrogenase-like beta-hydroxyacid dehydrogenase